MLFYTFSLPRDIQNYFWFHFLIYFSQFYDTLAIILKDNIHHFPHFLHHFTHFHFPEIFRIIFGFISLSVFHDTLAITLKVIWHQFPHFIFFVLFWTILRCLELPCISLQGISNFTPNNGNSNTYLIKKTVMVLL